MVQPAFWCVGLLIRLDPEIEAGQIWRLFHAFGNDDVAGGVALLHHSLDAERGNLLLARAGNVEGVDELVLDGLGDLAAGGLDRLGELLRRLMGDQCGLEEQQLLQVDVLAQLGGVVCDEARERLGLQPQAADGVALGEGDQGAKADLLQRRRSEEHTSELQSLMRISYAVFCLKKKNKSK